jgi:glycerophosphoryl diester phosphodiesterase
MAVRLLLSTNNIPPLCKRGVGGFINILRWALALFYDLMAVVALLMLATALLLPFNGRQRIPPGTLIYQIYLLVVAYCYFDFCWRHGGQTLGMKAWKLHATAAISHWQTLLRFSAGLLGLAMLGLIIALPFHMKQEDKTCCLVIAHAGGEIAGFFYTNSKEALDANYALGRRVFEIDFEKTSDGAWVLAHDWEGAIPTKAEFLNNQIQGQFTALSLEDLSAWLKMHPDGMIITDTKNNFSELFKLIHAQPELEKQIIYQAYSLDDIKLLRSQFVPGEKIIFTNYKAKLSEKELLTLVQQEKMAALTLPYRDALKISGNLHRTFAETPVYVHGSPASINSTELQVRLKDKGVSGYYLD